MPTQQQAGETACPYRLIDTKQKTTTCLGAKCMAWRWLDAAASWQVIRCSDRKAVREPTPRPSHVPAHFVFFPAEEGFDAGWHRPAEDDTRRGYCGMAGPVGQFDR